MKLATYKQIEKLKEYGYTDTQLNNMSYSAARNKLQQLYEDEAEEKADNLKQQNKAWWERPTEQQIANLKRRIENIEQHLGIIDF